MPDNVLDADPYVTQHPWGRPFWEATATGRFLLPRCTACGRAHWYPRPFCPFCAASDVRWVEACGPGPLKTLNARRQAAVPNIVAYVELDEGPVMLTNLVECEMAELAIGRAVMVRFRAAAEGRTVPVFAPVPAPAGPQDASSSAPP